MIGDGEEFSFIGRAKTEVIVVGDGRHCGVVVVYVGAGRLCA
jgi:hypothetical protein